MLALHTDTPAPTDVPVWMPGEYTRPIENPDYSTGDKLIRLAAKVFRFEAGDEFGLDEWQQWLIREVLQKYPAGHELAGEFVYEQVVVSMGRQNGKTVLGAVFALFGLILMVKRAPKVISLAATVDQAKNLYGKVRYCVDNVGLLAKRFKTTDRAGISSKNRKMPATYVVKAAGDGKGLQGFDGCLMLLDELHILKPQAWFALVLGASAQPVAMVLGLTTAGDDNSELLKSLYKTGRAAVKKAPDHNPRFGFFLWEADASLELYDPRALEQANPAISSGRLDLEAELRAGREMPESEYRRYRRNEFVSVQNTWMSLPTWLKAAGKNIPLAGRRVPLIISFARTRSSWDRVSVCASARIGDVVYTQLIATLTDADTEWLERVCVDLAGRFHIEKFVSDAETMRHTILALGQVHRLPAEWLNRGNMANATVTVQAMAKTGRLIHAGDRELQQQIPKTVTVNVGSGLVLDPRRSHGEIEAVMAMTMGVFMAEQQKEISLPFAFG